MSINLWNLLNLVRSFFEAIDTLRDRLLSGAIQKFWPRKIIPNHLTVVRIFIGLFLFVFLFYEKGANKPLVIALFFIGALTDLLDGSVARTLKEESQLGAMLDSTADRILIIPIAFYSLFGDHKWLLLIIVMLEIVNALMSIYAQGFNLFIPSNIFGKIKMFLQSIVFVGILIFWPHSPHIFFINVLWLSVISIIVSLFFKATDIKHRLYNEPR